MGRYNPKHTMKIDFLTKASAPALTAEEVAFQPQLFNIHFVKLYPVQSFLLIRFQWTVIY